MATISSTGLVTGVAAGSTTIQAASGSVIGSADLTVTAAVSSLVGYWTFDDESGTTAADSSGDISQWNQLGDWKDRPSRVREWNE